MLNVIYLRKIELIKYGTEEPLGPRLGGLLALQGVLAQHRIPAD